MIYSTTVPRTGTRSSGEALAEAYEHGAKARLADSLRLPTQEGFVLARAPLDIQQAYVEGWMDALRACQTGCQSASAKTGC